MDPPNPFVPVDHLTEMVLRLRPQLKTELKQLAQCVRLWPSIVEQPLASHTRPMDVRDHELYVGADSPVWAHAFRHQHNAVLRALRAGGLSVARLSVRVAAHPGQPGPPRRGRMQPSATVTDAMETTARSIQDDGLRDALMRLSETLRG